MLPLFAGAQGGLGALALIFLAVFLVIGGILFILEIFFLLTLSQALGRCRPRNRTMSPGQVWLMLLPFFNIVWQFFIANRVPESIRNEFLDRGKKPLDDFGRGVGMIMCVCSLLIWIPYLGAVLAVVYLGCWFLFWAKIAGFSNELARYDIEYYEKDDRRDDMGDQRDNEDDRRW